MSQETVLMGFHHLDFPLEKEIKPPDRTGFLYSPSRLIRMPSIYKTADQMHKQKLISGQEAKAFATKLLEGKEKTKRQILQMDNPGSQNVSTCKPVTTFVQTDTNTFRDVVQRLTGPSDNIAAPPDITMLKPDSPRKPASKLHERRQGMRPRLEIVKPPPSFKAIGATYKPPGYSSILASPVGTPSSLFSTLSLMEEERAESDVYTPNSEEEEKAIRERRFYLHPSPRSKPGFTEPELLPLFPLASPITSDRP